MKKIYFLLLSAAILLASCGKESVEQGIVPQDPESAASPYFVSRDEARSEVIALMNLLEQEPATRSGGSREIGKVYTVGGAAETRSDKDATRTNPFSLFSNEAGAPLFYIFNFENDEGFALASGDSRTASVFCITESGHLDPNNLPADKEALLGWLSNCETEYRMIVGLPVMNSEGEWVTAEQYRTPELVAKIDEYNNSRFHSPVETRADDYTYGPWGDWYTRATYGQKITVKWGQGDPYNTHTPLKGGRHAATGCTAVAVATIMAHWSYPPSYTHDNSAHTYYQFDWSEMKKHISTSQCGTHLYNTHDQIAGLMYALNLTRNLNADYGVNATGANHTNVPRTFRNFGFIDGGSTRNYSYTGGTGSGLGATLRLRPVYMRGNTGAGWGHLGWGIWLSSPSGGHAWVADQDVMQVRERAIYLNGVFIANTTEYRGLVHFNWGWNGTFDGYYHPTNFNTAEPYQYDGSSNSGLHSYFKYNLEMNTTIIN